MNNSEAVWRIHYAPEDEADNHPWHCCYGESIADLRGSSLHASKEEALEFLASHIAQVAKEHRALSARKI